MTIERTDVVIIGSGGAALIAACGAADAGAQVTVLERTPVFGGTTAVSGGMLWVGNNALSEQIGISDSAEETLTYLRKVTFGRIPAERLELLVAEGADLVRYLNDETPVQLFPINRPDYNAQWEGGKLGGRVLDNRPFETAEYEGLNELVREGSHFPPLTYEERHKWRWPENFDWELIAQRMTSGTKTLGGALAAGLVQGARDRGVRLVANIRARELVLGDSGVIGVRCETEDGEVVWRGDRAVILASGGFEWNADMTTSFLRGPTTTTVSPPWNVGDGIAMAMKAGARLGNMSEAWWAPAYMVPGEEYDGRPMSRHMIDELALPGSVVVNRAGRRFVRETVNYNDISKSFHVFDPMQYEYPNVPAWLVFDQRYKSSYAVATVMSGEDAPPWFNASDSLEELAGKVGIDPEGLADQIARFNEHALVGVDPDFDRGTAPLDRYYGDDEHQPNPCLGPITQAPFYAIEVRPGLLGTKGGVVTDLDGRAIDHSGNPIPGFFACSNAAASVMGPGYPGAGGSLGPLMTEALRCGRAAARN